VEAAGIEPAAYFVLRISAICIGFEIVRPQEVSRAQMERKALLFFGEYGTLYILGNRNTFIGVQFALNALL
jgi:hypothetical protein